MNISSDGALLEVNLDWQVMSKLFVSGMTGLLGIWGVLTSREVRRTLLTLRSAAIVLILVLGIPAGLSGFSQSALPSLAINFAYLMMVATALCYLRTSGCVIALLMGSAVLCGLSFVLYLGFPAYGVFEENLGSVTVRRMSGMSHPNSVGRVAAIGLLLAIAARKTRHITFPTFGVLFVLFSLGMAFTLSRTSIVACIIGIGFLYLDKVRSRLGIQLLTLAAALFLGAVFFLLISGSESSLADKVVGSVAKTGDASELTSGTGRAEIWTESIRLLGQRPLTGYGIGAAQSVLEEYSQSTHNMFLHAAMVSGIGGMLLMMGLAIHLLRIAFIGKYRIVGALAAVIMVSGIFEDTVLETFPGVGTILFFFCCLHVVDLPAQVKDDSATLGQTAS